MLFYKQQKIWLAKHKVDFRRGFQGLLAEAYRMGLDPFRGDLIIFVGRNRRRLKILYSDDSGLWISAKLFTSESMKTHFQFLIDPQCEAITDAELMMLIEGSRYTLERKVKSYRKGIDGAA